MSKNRAANPCHDRLNRAMQTIMGGRRAESIAWQEIGTPVSEDFVTLIVVAMLTSMTIILSLVA